MYDINVNTNVYGLGRRRDIHKLINFQEYLEIEWSFQIVSFRYPSNEPSVREMFVTRTIIENRWWDDSSLFEYNARVRGKLSSLEGGKEESRNLEKSRSRTKGRRSLFASTRWSVRFSSIITRWNELRAYSFTVGFEIGELILRILGALIQESGSVYRWYIPRECSGIPIVTIMRDASERQTHVIVSSIIDVCAN